MLSLSPRLDLFVFKFPKDFLPKEIEEKYPNLKLIIAHIGRAYAKEDIGNAFEMVGQGANTYFDFTANVCDDAIKACIDAVGTKRLLFGSDLPIAFMRMYRIVENGEYFKLMKIV